MRIEIKNNKRSWGLIILIIAACFGVGYLLGWGIGHLIG